MGVNKMFQRIERAFQSLLQDETGATAVEYAIILALIAISIVSGANIIGQSLNNKFSSTGTSVGPG